MSLSIQNVLWRFCTKLLGSVDSQKKNTKVAAKRALAFGALSVLFKKSAYGSGRRKETSALCASKQAASGYMSAQENDRMSGCQAESNRLCYTLDLRWWCQMACTVAASARNHVCSGITTHSSTLVLMGSYWMPIKSKHSINF